MPANRPTIARAALLLATALSATPAFAQDVTKPDPGEVSPAPAAGDIVVTGSRIARAGNESYAPIVSVPQESFEQTGAVSLEQTINKLPQFVGQNTATSNDNLLGSVNTLSLHGLGSARTLVLLDGHRLTPSLADGSVDISSIPEALLSNVEIITGGASTTYGSDAVAGVVNFRLNRDFTGLSADLQTGISERGDAGTQRISLAGGTKFAGDKGRVIVGLTYSNRDALYDYDRDFARISRPSSNFPQGAARASGANPATQAAIDAVFAKYGVAAGTVSPSSALGFNGDGSLFQFSNGTANYRGPSDIYAVTPSSVRYSSGSQNGLLTPYRKLAAFGYADYELTPGITVYGQANFLNYTAAQTYPAANAVLTVPVTNPFIPADLARILASRADATAPFTLAKRYTQLGDRIADYTSNSYDLTGGFRGTLPLGDWGYDIYGSYGRVHLVREASGTLDTDAIQTLLNAPGGGTGLCAGGFNFAGTAALSPACVAYASRTVHTVTDFQQRVAEADFQGGLFDLTGAGMIRAAIGASYRSNSYSYRPDALLSDPAIVSFGDAVAATSGTVNVKEVYGELDIPLVRDVFLIHRLSANVGIRYSDYNTSGGFTTWKASGLWEPVAGLQFKGGYARAIRSPGVDDLFTPQYTDYVSIGTAGSPGQGDPCDVTGAYRTGANGSKVRALCLAQGVPASVIDRYTFGDSQTPTGVAGGNPKLGAERARTITAGVTIAPKWTNPWLTGLSLSADYYNIRIDGAVVSLQGSDILQRCYNFDGTTNPTYSADSLYCGLLRRNTTTGEISYVNEASINAGRLATSGVDVTLRWRLGLDALGMSPDAGALTLTSAVGYLDTFTLRNFPTDATTDFAGSIGFGGIRSAHPRWKALTSLTYSVGGMEIGGQWRFIDKMEDVASIGTTDSGIPGVPSVSYFDVNLRYVLSSRYTMRFGVTNIGDKMPPTYTDNVQANTDPSTYDVVGRAFYFGVGIKL